MINEEILAAHDEAVRTAEAKLLADIKELVDPADYDGSSFFHCLIGQIAHLGTDQIDDEVATVAQRYSVEYDKVYDIYTAVDRMPGAREDFQQAVRVAELVLLEGYHYRNRAMHGPHGETVYFDSTEEEDES